MTNSPSLEIIRLYGLLGFIAPDLLAKSTAALYVWNFIVITAGLAGRVI
jgi:hypothetical protein